MGRVLSPTRQIILAVCLHPGNLHWRRILAGILDACTARGWLPIAIPDTSEGLGLLAHQRVHAAIVNCHLPSVARAAAGLDLPQVNLGHVDGGQPRVRLDDPAIGQAGAQALVAAGCRTLAFAGEHLGAWAVARRRGVQAGAGSAWHSSAPGALADYGSWIRSLPRQTGVLAANDEIAAQVAQAAANIGRSVPGSLRILGIDDDDLQCRFARTPLSSLRLDLEGLGARAVATCADLLAGRAVPDDQRVADVSVVERQSTTGARLGSLRETLLRLGSVPLEGLDVGRLALSAGVSRRTLARHMARDLACTPRQALLRQRLDRAELLLRTTSDSLAAIARQCGFCSASHLGRAFRRARGMTPGAWRMKSPKSGHRGPV